MICMKISPNSNVSKWNFTLLCYLLKIKWWKRKTGYMPRVIELLFPPWYTCKTWTIPNFSSPWLNNSILFASRTWLVLIQFLHHTGFISLQPSLSSFCLLWNHICTTNTFLVTVIPQNYSKAEIRVHKYINILPEWMSQPHIKSTSY